ncbi:mutS protein homolog 4 [Monosporozyma unispora]
MDETNLSSFIKAKIFESKSSKEEGTEDLQSENSERENSDFSTFQHKRVSKPTQFSAETQRLSANISSFKKKFLQTEFNRSCTTQRGSLSRLMTDTEVILCSLFEIPNPLSTKVGCCIINYDTGELVLWEIIDSQIFIRTLHRIQVYEPTLIILPSTSINPCMSKLTTILRRNISQTVKIKEVPNKNFSVENGFDALKQYTLNQEKLNLIHENLIERDFALAAVAGAVWFFQKHQDSNQYHKDLSFRYFRIRFENPEDTMLIDSKTILGLELIENKNNKNGLSLFSFLNNTVTPMGKRLLRNNILQPLIIEANISLRLETVWELVEKKHDLTRLIKELKNVEDLDKLFSKLLSFSNTNIAAEQKINYILVLKKTILTSRKIFKILQECNVKTKLLKEINNILSSNTLPTIIKLIDKNINEDCIWATSHVELQKQRIYAVKSGSNGLLKASREVYKSITNEILEEVKKLNNDYDIEIDYGYDGKRGFYLKLKKTADLDMDHLPIILIHKVLKKAYVECSTIELVKANVRLKETLHQILNYSEQTIDSTLKEIKMENMSPLFMVAEAIALLDLLCSFASRAVKHGYCKPTFSRMLHIKEGKHPVLENYISPFISNDIVSIKDSSNFHIITGCNASGKSVYLKQVALLCIMAQIGSFVPAQSGTFPIFKYLHARVCNDTMEVSTSNFAFEMKEIVYFLDNISPDSLLIIDELGRGSSMSEGLSICLATMEYLLSIKNTVFLSTHFNQLPRFLKKKLQVVHLDMKADIDSFNKLSLSYRLCSNVNGISNYGIRMVHDILDPAIIESAYKITKRLQKSKVIKNHTTNCSPKFDIECLNQMKKVNNAVFLISSLISTDETISSADLKNLQMKIIENI